MRTFFIDLASHEGLLTCADSKVIAASVSVDHRISDADLLPLFETVTMNAHWKPQDIERCVVCIGPGGFTSLRVALSFVNTLADTLHIPSAGVHLSDLTFARTIEENVLWVHSTKRSALFTRGFGRLASLWGEPTYVLLEDFLEKIPRDVLFIGEVIAEHETALLERGAKNAALHPLLEILPGFVEKLTYEKQILLPWYGRGW